MPRNPEAPSLPMSARLCAFVVLAGALLWAGAARAECGGNPQCIAVSFGDARPAHGTPETSAPLVFAAQTAGTASAAQLVRVGAVTGPPASRATIDSIGLVGANAAEFGFTTNCNTGMPSLLHDGGEAAQPANTCTIHVSFRPVVAGTRSASLQVRTAAITRTVPLSGTATPGSSGPTAHPASLGVQVNTAGSLDLAPLILGTVTGVVIATAPTHGTVTVEGTRVTYTPVRDYFGPDSFSYAAVNNVGSSQPATVSVNVGGRPDPARDAGVVGLLSAQAQAAHRFADAQVVNVRHRLESLRSRATTGHPRPAQRLAQPAPTRLASLGLSPPDVFLAMAGTPAQLTAALAEMSRSAVQSESDGAVWLAGQLDFGTAGPQGASPRNRFRTDGVTLGFDRALGERMMAGAGIGFAQDRTDVGTSGSASEARGFTTTLYGSWQSRGLFVDGILGYGQLRHDSQRFVPAMGAFTQYRDRRSRHLFASVAGGALHRRNEVLLSPYVRLDLARHRFEAATESGAGAYALTYFGHSASRAQFAVGLRAEASHATSVGMAVPRVRFELRHANSGGGDPTLAFADLAAGPVYTVALPVTDRTSALLGIGTDLAFRGSLTFGIDYLLHRSTESYRGHAVRAFLRQDLDGRGPAGSSLLPLARSPVQVEAAFMRDDNVNRGPQGSERLADSIYSLSATNGRTVPLGTHLRALVSGFLQGDEAQRHDGLDRLGIGARGELQYRASPAFSAPIFALFARAQHDRFRSDLRTGQRYAIGLSARQSWTDRIDTLAALTWSRRNADSAVFEGSDWGARLNLDYALGSGRVYLGGEVRQGDTVSTATATPLLAGIARASAPDDGFARAGMTAYRLEARTVIWTLGFNLPLGPRDSMDISWRQIEADPRVPAAAAALYAGGKPRYRANQLSLAYLTRF